MRGCGMGWFFFVWLAATAMGWLFFVWLAAAAPALAGPRCNPPGLQNMADEKQRAIAVSVWKRLATDEDRREGGHAATARLEREVGGVKDCEEWAREHGKPDETPGKGPRR